MTSDASFENVKAQTLSSIKDKFGFVHFFFFFFTLNYRQAVENI